MCLTAGCVVENCKRKTELCSQLTTIEGVATKNKMGIRMLIFFFGFFTSKWLNASRF